MNTTEKNELLAEFMGVKKELFWFNLKTGNYVKKENTDCEIEQVSLYVKNNKPITSFLYHSDWNWLMEVVEKILQKCAEMDELEKYWEITDVMPYINNVYSACVEFVKWYNQN